MTRILPWLTPLLALLFALSPLASDGFNGFTPDQFPVVQDRWPVQPAGWAFSIWGVIYTTLIAGLIFGARRAPDAPDWQAMRAPLCVSLGLGIFWIAAANVAPLLATAMIVVMAVAAVAAFLRAPDTLWALGPVGLYAGWLTAATGVAIAVCLSGYGLLSAQVAALVLIAVVLVAALVVQARRPRGWSYPLAVGWALFGITVANRAPLTAVTALAAAGLGIVAIRAIWGRI